MKAEDRYDSLIRYYAGVSNRDPKQVKRQIRAESAFNPRAESAAGAKGLLQFMDATWHEIGWPGEDVYNPEANIRAGCKYMAVLENACGTLALALAAYNWGIGHVRQIQDDPQWMDRLPAETEAYVRKCLDFAGEVLA